MKIADSFDEHYQVEPVSGCWNWQRWCQKRTKHSLGYGFLKIDGRRVFAHRFSYERSVGRIPVGLCVLHRCDNPICVRPDHLFLGTRADNNRDKARKGRAPITRNPIHGERNGSAKLSAGQVHRIQDIYRTGTTTQSEIAGYFNVSESQVRRIIVGENWGGG